MRVLLIDDHALVRKGLEALLQSRNIEVAASVGSGQEGIDEASKIKPDVILLDINMPGMNGLETLKELRHRRIESPVLMLTMSREESDLRAALQNGAQGYLLKDMEPEELIPALEAVASGDNIVAKELVGSLTRIVQSKNSEEVETSEESPFAELTPRELEILGHIAEGQSNKAIARDLDISDGTVKLHVKSILRKLGMHSRVEAAVKAVEHGLGGKQKG
jgi:two-component system nitrate/nitrite response regulator NarL